MNSRERVLAALQHKEPDRIPLDLGGTESSGISGIAYNKLKKHLGINTGRTQIFDVYQQVAKIETGIRKTLNIDTIPLLLEPRQWKPFYLPDDSSCEIPEKWCPQKIDGDLIVYDSEGHITARMPGGGFYFDPVYTPLSEVTDPAELDEYDEEIESYDWPFFADESLDEIEERAKILFKETEWAIVSNLQLHLLSAGQILRGYEAFMLDLLINKKLVHAFLEKLTDAYIRRCEMLLEGIGDYIQVVLLNDDLGTQQGPMLSLDCYREMILPYQKRLFTFIKKKTGAFILFHSCGSVYQFIPDLIEAGVDALNPVQVSAADMNTQHLKKEFDKDITFWGGGCDTQSILNGHSTKAIEEEVKHRINDLAPHGGFVFSQVHNIQPDIPPENIMAMYKAFKQYCNY